ncbi:MAG TPA: HEAT repeat domain-containing protein [Methanomicrobiales archaeon]|nr:HEAT repeat domain-containing protein [Methanomicrobiales archaeon]
MVGIGMPLLSPGRPRPDIALLKESGNTNGLIRLLGHPDPGTRWRAAEALGSMGGGAVGDLLSSLGHHDPGVRLGIVEALGSVGDPRAIGPLLGVLAGDRSAEVRWAAALALGNLGDAGAVPALAAALQDPDKYIRLGAALSLGKLGWEPAGGGELAALLIARQDWPSLPALGQGAAGPLIRATRDPDPGIRARAVGALGEIGGPGAAGACDPVLRDPDGAVRWTATLAFPKCGIPLMHLPMGLARRPRPGKSPAIAAFLNLLFLGLGYNYLGRWYGILLFQLNLTAIVLASLALGPLLPYAISYGISTPFAIQTWYLARKMEEEAP